MPLQHPAVTQPQQHEAFHVAMSNRFGPLLRLKSASIEEHHRLGCAALCHAAREVPGPQPRRHQGCRVFSKGTRSLIATKRVTAVTTVAAPHVC